MRLKLVTATLLLKHTPITQLNHKKQTAFLILIKYANVILLKNFL